MDLNVVVRGQSNAFLMVSGDLGGVGARVMIDETQRLLGFDGVNDRVLLDDWYTPNQVTVFGATAFIGDWVARDANGAWQPLQYEQSLLRNMAQNPPSTETAIVWLHNEYDSLNPDLTAAEWTSAVRADAALVRGALGLEAARSPYVFVSAIPFPTGDGDTEQGIRAGMEALGADPAFGAVVGARALDVDMSFKFPFEEQFTDYTYGLSHISAQDAAMIGERLARSLAEEWAAYAKPGSPVALSGGDIASDGPKVVSATLFNAETLVVKVLHDQSAGFAALDPQAASGVGWVVGGASAAVSPDAVWTSAPDTLVLHFPSAIPTDGYLYYGYGYGRLAATDQPGQGNAIYDLSGLPVWTPAVGVKVNAPA
ncbi:MAG: hypothetical protein ICV73_18275, partial [Acetobacteraceae bacterium]|nr:hypothetical protein [Acetobacteraceae bacterium]